MWGMAPNAFSDDDDSGTTYLCVPQAQKVIPPGRPRQLWDHSNKLTERDISGVSSR